MVNDLVQQPVLKQTFPVHIANWIPEQRSCLLEVRLYQGQMHLPLWFKTYKKRLLKMSASIQHTLMLTAPGASPISPEQCVESLGGTLESYCYLGS